MLNRTPPPLPDVLAPSEPFRTNFLPRHQPLLTVNNAVEYGMPSCVYTCRCGSWSTDVAVRLEARIERSSRRTPSSEEQSNFDIQRRRSRYLESPHIAGPSWGGGTMVTVILYVIMITQKRAFGDARYSS